ncbi:hypothetical protein EST35_0089 [Pseudomonas phage vB_PaeM_PA5oct]|uniref:Uncharacterized protein n=1 Tax=Pseudomonas phage vB_PaeM_PA5oct TaxID=2163605 RepID=A0A4Y5JUZ5_9CAUD|nr:hypothetical protein PQE65_gp394 [Pseudomonas phage vB_PaeM_PA5oct]QCG75971.1 hypothetical protein EST35_0089 [Pseudomonas phage vB_PaeM_PA5oct]
MSAELKRLLEIFPTFKSFIYAKGAYGIDVWKATGSVTLEQVSNAVNAGNAEWQCKGDPTCSLEQNSMYIFITIQEPDYTGMVDIDVCVKITNGNEVSYQIA